MPNSQLSSVVVKYTEPWRVQHNIDLPATVLKTMKMLNTSDTLSKWLVDFAWYKDAIYVPGADNNQLASAELFAEHVCATKNDEGTYEFKFPSEENTFKAIVAMQDPFGMATDPLIDVCVDASVSMLGLPHDEYLDYCFGIEAEFISYHNVIMTGDDRMKLRIATKTYLVERQKYVMKVMEYAEEGNVLYRTRNARRLWEERAYTNLFNEHKLNIKRFRGLR